MNRAADFDFIVSCVSLELHSGLRKEEISGIPEMYFKSSDDNLKGEIVTCKIELKNAQG